MLTSACTDFTAAVLSILAPGTPDTRYTMMSCIDTSALADIESTIDGAIKAYANGDLDGAVSGAKKYYTDITAALEGCTSN